jgi:hypothetical protein
VSIAAEGGLLTPQINVPGGDSIGGSIDVITSYRWSWGTAHWNEWFQFTRDAHADLYTGVILEGPHDWTVRPVAELYFDEDFVVGPHESALVGAIWHVRDSFDLDVGVRGGRVTVDGGGSVYEAEVRLGLTWAIAMWETGKPEVHD